MLNLIKMDFSIYKFNLIFMLVYSIFFAALLNSISFMGTVALLCVYMVVLTALATEEQNQIHLLHKSLPVTNGQIVGAKYAETVIVWIMSIIFSALPAFAAGYVKQRLGTEFYFPAIKEFIFFIIDMFALSMILVSIMMPLIYKFGYTKGRLIISIIWFAAAFGIPSMLQVSIVNETNSYGLFISESAICAGMVILAAIITVASFFTAVKIYGQK